MTTNRLIKNFLTCCSAAALVACASGGGLPESVARAQAAPAAQTQGGLISIADDMAQKGDHEAAIPLYRHLANTTRSPAAINGLANSLLAIGDMNAAQQILMDFINHEGSEHTNGEVFYTYGKASLALGDFSAALNGFEIAAIKMPNDTRASSGKAIALAAAGNSAAAIAAISNNTDLSSLSNKALILAASNKPAAAVNILEPIVATGNSTARDRQNLAMAYLLAGDEEQAYRMARLDLDPATINETFTFYRTLGSLDEAQRMQALVTGVINPEWSREETANLLLENTVERQAAAERLTAPEPTIVAEIEPVVTETVPVKAETITANVDETATPEKYGLTAVPPLVEKEGWALQIGAYRTINRLMQGWALLSARNVDILSDIPPRRSEVDFGQQEDGPSGFYYRLNAGPLASFSEAKTLCDELIDRGTSCWIRPPEKEEGSLPGR